MLREHGIPLIEHRARQIRPDEYDIWDLLIYMDEENHRWLERIFRNNASWRADEGAKTQKLLAYAGNTLTPPARDRSGRVRDVADPWYTGNFDSTYRDVLAGCKGLLQKLA